MYYLVLGFVGLAVLRVSYEFAPTIIKDIKDQPAWVVVLKCLYYLGGGVFFAGFMTAIIGFGEFQSMQTFSFFLIVTIVAGLCGLYAGYKHKLN